ncbi:uncharacterized protein LOC121990851 [Zingiber officinale]|uniref:uncharacterized protein LOC121990851 n=1 Tax=Zingiber officinale TaxID=94328 RepID=UPI001C4C7205|nr:uncharacterized protein LOC121990851 [Zingiber officinale]
MDKSMIDAAAGGALVNKTPEQARELISNMAENSQQFGSRALTTRRVGEVQMVSNEQKEIRNSLMELTTLVKQLSLNNATQPFVVPNMQFPCKQSIVCSICSSQDHLSELCPNLHQDESLAAFSRAQFQQKHDPISATLPAISSNLSKVSSSIIRISSKVFSIITNLQINISNRINLISNLNQNQHYQSQNQNFQQAIPALPAPTRLSLTQGGSNNASNSDPQQARLEELMQQILLQNQNQQRTDSALQNLERQIGQLASSINQIQAQGSGQLPSQTTPNPKGNVSALTLRSGRKVSDISREGDVAKNFPKMQQFNFSSEEIPEVRNVPMSSSTQIHKDPLDLEHEQGRNSCIPEISSKFSPDEQFPAAATPESSKSGNAGFQNSEPSIPLPFPQRKVQPRKNVEEEKAKEFQELVDLFSKVEVNVPLLTMIKQIPKYAKFLKDLCVHKKKLKGNELISMGKNVSALLQPVPHKCEDPGVFTIPCEIGSSLFKDAMLDLGASINVMPKSIF